MFWLLCCMLLIKSNRILFVSSLNITINSQETFFFFSYLPHIRMKLMFLCSAAFPWRLDHLLRSWLSLPDLRPCLRSGVLSCDSLSHPRVVALHYCKKKNLLTMADEELDAIRRQRMAELQAKQGVRTRLEQGNVYAAA